MSNEYVWKSDIAQKAQQFLQIKHMTGFKYDAQKKYLQRFDTYYSQNGYTGIRITKEMVDGFIYRPDERMTGWYVKERLLRDFAVFLQEQCFSKIYIPMVQSAPPRSSFTPYIFTVDKIRRLFEAVDSWEDSPFTNRVLIDPIFFRLLYSTGMRLSEALNLTLKDFDNGVTMRRITKIVLYRCIRIWRKGLNTILRMYTDFQKKQIIFFHLQEDITVVLTKVLCIVDIGSIFHVQGFPLQEPVPEFIASDTIMLSNA